MQWDSVTAVLTPQQMAAADKAAIASGVTGAALMESAGRAVMEVILQRYDPCRTLILCGPGNNGGDGFVVARLLAEAGWPVTVVSTQPRGKYKGDAAAMVQAWKGEILPLEKADIAKAELLVDALFGTGLGKPVVGEIAALIERMNDSDKPVVAVDIPSGIDGAAGAIKGVAVAADCTVTFARKKVGHLLLPGFVHAGEVHLADIGIADKAIIAQKPSLYENTPQLWREYFPQLHIEDHKYKRGHSIVLGGDIAHSGAALLAAEAALRVGSGLVTQLVPQSALAVYATASKKAVMTRAVEEMSGFLEDERANAWLLGPGLGIGKTTREKVIAVLKWRKKTVLDADTLSSFAGDSVALFEALHQDCLLTPHEGEFARLFPQLTGTKLERAQQAAILCGAHILLKGPDTILASPDGTAILHAVNAPQLATAGSGDVLAGLCTGLIAQGMPVPMAAAAAIWLHARAALLLGRGLIADDLVEIIPAILQEF